VTLGRMVAYQDVREAADKYLSTNVREVLMGKIPGERSELSSGSFFTTTQWGFIIESSEGRLVLVYVPNL
jgi:hypothetical protein